MHAMVKLLIGMWRLPLVVRIWLAGLMAVNMAAPLLFLDHAEAKVVLATACCNVVVMAVLTAKAGFTRILGLGHLLWIPLLGYGWLRLGYHPALDPVALWLRLLLVLNTISLGFDAIDVLRYLRGDRAEIVAVGCGAGHEA
ncbi:MAG: hypothetical protein COW73_01285 [Nitrospirae bacterium CG18_big_fil_WC_8_21_14_2_50_70_55]|nr:hypothetical protein [Deltaproteobacteria bacterium]OIP67576.1 MAG: hypothetical protein AUK30_00540 [Nitrospirae bacterium CG2_30_70_394]PIQ07013.1 MAG: hypothetical protein COW73_01285 [Nitrospirae bacterium CG18_big_fil_WC_8_21_14_2_50_70_55]PIU78363.1 MAG: hypothetical protein COS73_07400 [Nitrospirae bacterium CG06_land_8_20_14_3_00_70_43]PIW83857.1 MAG: hypothetical protein COZ96_01155 [Nitrospirae bacterium CG_4_8_14_3_um_filter_70_85]PIX83017.1 MAG: hypothetical protein COZ33_07670 